MVNIETQDKIQDIILVEEVDDFDIASQATIAEAEPLEAFSDDVSIDHFSKILTPREDLSADDAVKVYLKEIGIF